MRTPAFLFLAFTLSQMANAALIDNGAYLTDTVSGLDWLKLTQTIDRSYTSVSGQLGDGGEFAGWQYASGAQFEALLLNQGIAPDIGCADSTSFCGGANSANYSSINNLVNLIGDTFEYANNGGTLTSASNASLGLLSDSNDSGHYVGLLVGSICRIRRMLVLIMVILKVMASIRGASARI